MQRIASQKRLRRHGFQKTRRRQLVYEFFESRLMLDGELTNSALSALQRQTLLDGLSQVATWSGQLEQSSQLGLNLAALNKTLGQSVQLSNGIATGMVSPLASQPSINTDQFVQAIKGLTNAVTGITVNPANVTGGRLSSPQGDEIQFNLKLELSRSTLVGLNLGQQLTDTGLKLDAPIQVPQSSNASFTFTFGLDLTPGLSAAQSFFIRPQALSLSTAVNASNVSTNAKLGLLVNQVQNASIQLEAAIGVSVLNPDSDAKGNITWSELSENSVYAITQQTIASNNLDGTLPLQATLGSQSLNAALGADPTVLLDSANVFAGSELITATPNAAFRELQNFKNIQASGLITSLDRAGRGLDEWTPRLDINSDLGGFGYTDVLPSEIADFEGTIQSLIRKLYDPVITATGRMNEGAGYSLSNNASFSIRLNDAETIPVVLVRESQSTFESVASFFNRSLPMGLYNRITASIQDVPGDGRYFRIRAVDPSIQKLEILFGDKSNSISFNLGFSPSQVSLPEYKFDTIQSFDALLAQQTSLVGVDPFYDIADHSLSFRLRLTGQPITTTVPLDFRAGLGPFSYLKPSTASYSVTPSLDGRVGIQLDRLQTVLTASGDAPANGRIPSAARLSIKLNGAAPVTVTVLVDNTNTNIDDLVADINAALNRTSLKGKVVAGRTASRLTLTSDTDTGLEVESLPGDPAETVLQLVGVGTTAQWGQHVSLAAGTSLQLQTEISTASLTGAASLGILPIHLSTGNLQITASASATLLSSKPVGQMDALSQTDLAITPPVSQLVGHFVPNVDASLGVSSSNPASIDLRLSSPHEWSTRLVGSMDAPVNGRLSSPANFSISLGSGTPVSISVPVDVNNQTIDDLVSDISAAMVGTRLNGNVLVSRQGNRIVLSTFGFFDLAVSSAVSDSATTQLGFGNQSVPSAIGYDANQVFQEKLAALSSFKVDQFSAGVAGILKLFEENRLNHLTSDIPLFNQSLDDVLGVSQKLRNSLLSLQGKSGIPLKETVKGIVANLRNAILALPTSITESDKSDLVAIADRLREAAQNAERTDIPLPVHLASVIVASLEPMNVAIAKVSKSGVDLTNLNAVRSQLQNVTPSLLQIGTLFSNSLGVGSTTSTFTNAKPSAFEQAMVVRTQWTPNTTRAMNLNRISLPNGLGPLKFANGSTINLNATGDFRFEFGVNFATGEPFLLDTSRFTANAALGPASQAYPATIGGVSVVLGNPTTPASLLLRNQSLATPATLAATIQPTPSSDDIGNWSFGDVISQINYSSVSGRLDSVLPVYVTGNNVGNVTVAWSFPGASAALPPLVTAPANLIPALETLPYNFSLLTEGIDTWNVQLKKVLREKILGEFPLLREDIDVDMGFMTRLENQFLAAVEGTITTYGGVDSSAFRIALSQAIETALAPILVPNSVSVSITGSPELKFRIAGSDVYQSGLDVNLPGLRFETFEAGQVNVNLNYNMRLGFGLSKTEGFYFIIDREPGNPNGPQFTMNIGATLSPTSEIKSQILNLPVVATTNTSSGQSLTRVAPTDVLIRFPDSDNHLTIDQVDTFDVIDEFDIGYGPGGAHAHLDLHLLANSFDAVNGNLDLPGLVTDLVVDQNFAPFDRLDESGAIPVVSLKNIGLGLGTTFGKVVKPIVDQVNEYLAPIKPAIAALDSEVPVLSALSKRAGKGRLTWIDAIAKFSNDPTVQETVDAMKKVVEVVKSLMSIANAAQAIANATSNLIAFGDYNFHPTFDLRLPHANGINPAIAGTFVPNPAFVPTNDSTISPYVKNSDSEASTFFDDLREDGFRFPIFEDPSSIVPLLFGQDVTIVLWQMPPFRAKMKSPEIFIGVVPVGPVPVMLHAGLLFDVSANIGIGFDSRGFKEGHEFLDGFFFKDDGRGKPPVLYVGAGIYINASAGIPFVARVGIEGQLSAGLTARWHNPDGDDKLHLDELLDNLAQGPDCLMDLGGQMTAQLFFFISTFVVSVSIPIIPEITLLDFDIFSCSPLPPPELAHISDPVGNPENDFENTTIGPNTLILNIGAFAGQRNPGRSEDTDERIQIFEYDPGIITVVGFGQSKVYGSATNPIASIYADGGLGKNIILVDDSVMVPTTLVGGPGDDRIRGGSGRNRIFGRGGRDVLIGGIDKDTIVAGIGESKLYGGPGDDSLYAHGGVNYLDGEDGNDFMQGGTGPDAIYGGRGNDQIRGGGGADHLYGEQDDDIIIGEGIGGVYIEGGRGNNHITGSNGRDVIYAVRPEALPGEAGNNIVFGLGENDLVYGGIDGINEIHGGAGDDILFGGDLGDLIHAGSGKDFVYGFAGNDTLYADSGENYIYGGIGDDKIYGSSGLLSRPLNWPSQTPDGWEGTYAGSGTDHLYGEAGNDTIYGGFANGEIFGGPQTDYLYGGNGSHSIHGDDGDDYLWTGDGEQTISGDAGIDLLEQRATSSQSLTDTTIAGRGLHQFEYVERVRLVNSSTINSVYFDVSGYTGPATLLGAPSGNDIVKLVVDADVRLVNGNISTSNGGSFSLQNITRADISGIQLDNLFDVSLWTGTATLRSGTGRDRVYSANDANFLLSDSMLVRASGGSFSLSSIKAVTLGGGPSDNQIDASAFSGNVWIYGAGGNDTLRGGSGHDFLDGGMGMDSYFAGSGDDVIDASQNSSSTISADDGDDLVYGSNGNDVILLGAGDDRVYAGAGDDTVGGGLGNDILDGNDGNDTLSGDAGADVIVGGAHSDVLYAFNSSGTGDDRAVNYLYGDFGTGGLEPNAGNDQLISGLGNDQSFGEGGTNSFSGGGPGAVARDGIAIGLRPNQPPAAPPKPVPPSWPPSLPGQSSTLPTGPTTRGRWTELVGSASLGGVSRTTAAATSPSIAVGIAGPVMAWADSRSGTSQIYVALQTIAGWQSLAGSVSAGGVSSRTSTSSSNQNATNPSVVVDNSGMPIVAWTQNEGSSRNIYVARYDALANSGNGDWVPMGSSLSPGGISLTGQADRASVVMTSLGPVVAWLNTLAGITNVYAKRFENGAWVSLGVNGASGSGVSASATSVAEFAIATDGNRIAIAWPQDIGGRTQIYLRQLESNAWNTIGGSASGNGISGTSGFAVAPSIAYFNGNLTAVWQDNTSSRWEVYASRYDGANWIDAGENSRADGGVSNTRGSAVRPKIASNAGRLSLVWQDDRVAAGTGNSVGLYSKHWKNDRFEEELPGDARDRGIADLVTTPGSHALAMDSAGHPFVAWSDTVSGKSDVYLIANTFDIGTIHYVNDSDTGAPQIALNSFSTAPGNDSNDGLSPSTPKRSLQAVFTDALRPVSPFDVILVDSGDYSGASLSGANTSRVLILGSTKAVASLSTSLNLISAQQLTVNNLRLAEGTLVFNSQQVSLDDNDIRGFGAIVFGGSGNHLNHNQIQSQATGVMLANQTTSAIVASNIVRGGTRGLALAFTSSPATDGAIIQDNQFYGSGIGISVENVGTGVIRRNRVDSANVGIQMLRSFAGSIVENEVRYSGTGANYAAASLFGGNRLRDNSLGIVTTVNSNADGLGFYGELPPNLIYRNATGVQLVQARMQNQLVSNNSSGVIGSGSLEPIDLAHANRIVRNQTGVSIDGPVQFNSFDRNTRGIFPRSRQLIAHNEFNNNSIGIDISAVDDLRIFSNTFYTELGTNVKLSGNAKRVELINNLLWTDDGYDIYVDDNSTVGFFSDYNSLVAGPNGKLVHWTKDFVDILDWQEDVYQFDLNSIGTTVLDPTSGRPHFVGLRMGDFRVFAQTARLRETSPTLDRGDVRADQGRPTSFSNLLTNPSFEADLSGWTVAPAGAIGVANPPAYDGAKYFSSSNNPTTSIEQTIDLISKGILPSQVDNQELSASFGTRVRSGAEEPVDEGTLTVSFLDDLGTVIGAPYVLQSANDSNRWQLIGGHSYLPIGTRSIRFRFEAVRRSGVTNDVFLDHAFVSIESRTRKVDLGARGNTAEDILVAPHIEVTSPDLYKDWERSKPIDIRWESTGNTEGSPVIIDLWRDTASGPQYVTQISSGTPDDGSFTWIAANSGVSFATYGLRVEVSLAVNRTIVDRSSESFTVPEDTNTFFVNDRVLAGDEYTSAAGNNRNTGKLADRPKPYPNNVLRIYSLGASQTLSVDSGSYPLLYPLVVSNILGVGDDEGFLFQGAEDHDTSFSHANPFTTSAMLELDNADFLTLRNVRLDGGTIGLHVHNQSTELNAADIRVVNATAQGVLIDSGSSAQVLQGFTVTGTNGPGFKMQGALGVLRDSQIANNRGVGLELIDTGASIIERNEIANNYGNGAYGVSVSNSGVVPTLFGNLDLSQPHGNRVYGNTLGVQAVGAVTVSGNTVYDHLGNGVFGIRVLNGATASRNVVFNNFAGIYSNSGTISGNRVYRHTNAGIQVERNESVQDNVVYNNAYGVWGPFAYAGTLINNVIYSHGIAGVALGRAAYYGGTPTLVNNTIYEPSADAVRIYDASNNVRLRNNILWVNAGAALHISADSQGGFQSDYNDLYATGNGKIAIWQNQIRSTLATWRTTAFTDSNSLSVNPQFVSMAGADGIVGYVNASQDGRDDDFHLKSLHGSFHDVAFAPVTTGGGVGAPVFVVQPANPIQDAISSPLLDRGSPLDVYAAEPTPNGNYINIGAYGGTTQASISPAEYVLVTNPDGGEIWPHQQSFPIRWRTQKEVEPGFALSFDGNDDVVAIGNLGNRPVQGTIEFWMNPAVMESYRNVLTTGPYTIGGQGNRAIRFEEIGGDLYVIIGGDSADDGAGYAGYKLNSASAIPTNTWTHIAVTWDSSANSLKGYRNGEEVFSVSHSQWPSQFNNVTLGVGWGTSRYYRGQLDDVRFWSTRRSAIEIQSAFQAKLTGTESGLMALYQLDSGVGTVAVNGVAGGVNGVLGGGNSSAIPTWVARDYSSNTTFKIELLGANNETVLTIADAAPDTGQYAWTVPSSVPPSNGYRIRVTRNDGSNISDTSDGFFEIRAAINTYYVNDAAFEAGDLTTAVGDDANSGLDPSSPKRSISAVLNAYVMKPGDVILVDAGTYNLTTTLVLNAATSGIRIEGYHSDLYPSRRSVFNRGNTSFNAIELVNADNLTLSYLAMTGGSAAIFASGSSDTDNLVLDNLSIYGNPNYGILLETSNDFATITNSFFDGLENNASQNYHLWTRGSNVTISGNRFTRSGYDALNASGVRLMIDHNTFTANGRGNSGNSMAIGNPSSGLADQNVVSSNVVVGGTAAGISTGYNTLVIGNDVSYANTGIVSNGIVRDNSVHHNPTGIVGSFQSTITGNRIFKNSGVGLYLTSNAINGGNRIYDNDVGVYTDLGFSGAVTNNLIYQNTTYGVLVEGTGYYGSIPEIRNNTIYSTISDLIRVRDGRAQNVTVENNILVASGGYIYNVSTDSERGFNADFNILYTTGLGKIATWEGRNFTSRSDWFYELGFDQHSLEADPQFVDLDGVDNRLGFNRGNGLLGEYFATSDLSGPVILTRVDPTIAFESQWGYGSPDPLIPVDNFSVRWQGYLYVPTAGTYTFYEQSDDGARLYLNNDSTPIIDQWSYVGYAERSNTFNFAAPGHYPIKLEMREIASYAAIKLSWSGPGISKQIISRDYLGTTPNFQPNDFGADDDFHLLPTSPAIDLGNPYTPFFLETTPNGGRVDAGAYGNTPEAAISPVQNVQVYSPNGLEKFEQGQTVTATVLTTGLRTLVPVMTLNAGGNSYERWQKGSNYATSGFVDNDIFELRGVTVNRSGVAEPLPETLYHSSLYSNVALKLPLPDGNYSVRLHFVEPQVQAAGQRRFDIKLNGAVVRSQYDIFVAAGGRHRAVAENFDVAVTGGAGLALDLVNVTNSALLAGIEIYEANPIGTPSPTVDIEYSLDNMTWNTIAMGVSVDRFGVANFQWTVPQDAIEAKSYRIRATSLAATGSLQDTSDGTFTIANSGNDYYINDGSLVGDLSTSAIGNNFNTGKSPDQPMSSLRGLLAMYDLDVGDTIHIDTGNYRLISSIVIGAADSGVTLSGPQSGSGAILDRANTDSRMFELLNADDVTLQYLTLKNSSIAVYAPFGSDSDHFTADHVSVVGNPEHGIFLDGSNDFVTIRDSFFDGLINNASQNYHVRLHGNDLWIEGNHFTRSGYDAVWTTGRRSMIRDNSFLNNGRGNSGNSINATNPSVAPEDLNTIRNNNVIGGTANGIFASANTLVTENDVSMASTGISGSATVRNNVVHHNIYYGIVGGFQNQVVENRIYSNTGVGLFITDSAVNSLNRIYNNAIGVQTQFGFSGALTNNLIYRNTQFGVVMEGAGYYGGSPRIVNNTIVQSQGDAIKIRDGRTGRAIVRNNIFYATGGYLYNVDADSERGFEADYNILYTTGTAKIARWEERDFIDRADWFYEIGVDQRSSTSNPMLVDVTGVEPNLQLLAGSPAIDAGDPSYLAIREPALNGGRIDIGAYGGTSQAFTSSTQVVHLLHGNGLEKFEQGQSVTIPIKTSGISEVEPILLLNAGTNDVGNWRAAGSYGTGFYSANIATPVDLSNVADPAPQQVYQSLLVGNYDMNFRLPVRDGDYQLRLHFVETDNFGNSGYYIRRFDIRLNNDLVKADYDIYTEAGGLFKAKVETFNVSLSGGTGLQIDLIRKLYYSAQIAAIELVAVNPNGDSANTARIELSSDNGATWSNIASNIPIDRWGHGAFNWMIPTNQAVGDQYRLRLSSTTSVGIVSDVSNENFQIANGGSNYYLSSTGDNRNSGKQSDRPMRTLAALLDLYDLDSGDLITVNSGTYRLYRSAIFTNQDSGVSVEGAADAPSTFNRGNYTSERYVITLQNVDDLSLKRLRITGAEVGVFAANESDSDRLTLSENSIFGNTYAGIHIGSNNDRWIIESNKMFGIPGGTTQDDQSFGILYYYNTISVGHQVVRNEIYDHRDTGILGPTVDTLVANNDIHGNRFGIYSQWGLGVGALPLVIRDNDVHDNTDYGIWAHSVNTRAISVIGNKVYGHSGTNDVGMYIYGGTEAIDNEVFQNFKGIVGHSNFTPPLTSIRNNRVYGNSNAAITAEDSVEVTGNYVYSNSVGIQALPGFRGSISNNLLYSNTNQGLLIQNSFTSGLGRYWNNTIYQPVGDGIRVENSAINNSIYNNIVWVLAGYGIYVASNSQTNFASDHNLFFFGNDPNSNVGFWGGVARKTLADWKAASAKDPNSQFADPGFVDIDGADNVLGFVASSSGGTHGGADDNFYRVRNSPAIDRGSTWISSEKDIEGFVRVDDPGVANAGGPTFQLEVQSSSNFASLPTGTPQNWRNDDGFWTLNLPFAFPYYGTLYSSVHVSSNGLLQFSSSSSWPGYPINSTEWLKSIAGIAPLWDDLRTDQVGDDIFIDSSVAGRTIIRWNATNKANGSDVQFAVTLHSNGHFDFDYGSGNTGLSPTVGISRGDGRFWTLADGYNGASSMANAATARWTLVPGVVDVGAYEFRGSSLDSVSPIVVGTTPEVVHGQGLTALSPSELEVTFSEEINPIDARSSATYELRSSGPNDILGDFDDIIYPLRPAYTPGQNTVTLGIGRPDGSEGLQALGPGRYRLTILGTTNSSIYDLAGNRFDGDSDGNPGGNYVRVFRVIANQKPVLVGANPLTPIDEDVPVAQNLGSLVSSIIANNIVDSDGPAVGVAIVGIQGTSGIWEYAVDGANFFPIASQLAGGRSLLLGANSDERIRFLPNANYFGNTQSLQLRAWDQADGTPSGTSVELSSLTANSISDNSFATTIAVNSKNDAPTDITLNALTILENTSTASDLLFGTLSANDPDAGDLFSYAMASGSGDTDNSRFVIRNGNEIYLKSGELLDFETRSSYAVRVQVTDAGGLSFVRSLNLQVTDVSEVESLKIDSGSTQRSVIRSLTITFDGVVSVAEDAFELRKRGAGGGVVNVAFAPPQVVGGKTVVTLTFSGLFSEFGSLVDGEYQLRIFGTRINSSRGLLDGNKDGILGDDYVFGSQSADRFFRLFGDANGDRTVAVNDFNSFRSTFGKNSTQDGYIGAFDFSGDGTIGINDFNEFRLRFGRSI